MGCACGGLCCVWAARRAHREDVPASRRLPPVSLFSSFLQTLPPSLSPSYGFFFLTVSLPCVSLPLARSLAPSCCSFVLVCFSNHLLALLALSLLKSLSLSLSLSISRGGVSVGLRFVPCCLCGGLPPPPPSDCTKSLSLSLSVFLFLSLFFFFLL